MVNISRAIFYPKDESELADVDELTDELLDSELPVDLLDELLALEVSDASVDDEDGDSDDALDCEELDPELADNVEALETDVSELDVVSCSSDELLLVDADEADELDELVSTS